VKVRFHPAARDEFLEAIRYYESISDALGLSFEEVIYKGLDAICRDPFAGFAIDERLRRLVILEFPYSIIYANTAQTVIVLAIAYSSRCPKYWEERD